MNTHYKGKYHKKENRNLHRLKITQLKKGELQKTYNITINDKKALDVKVEQLTPFNHSTIKQGSTKFT
jgi:hypothetical protein